MGSPGLMTVSTERQHLMPPPASQSWRVPGCTGRLWLEQRFAFKMAYHICAENSPQPQGPGGDTAATCSDAHTDPHSVLYHSNGKVHHLCPLPTLLPSTKGHLCIAANRRHQQPHGVTLAHFAGIGSYTGVFMANVIALKLGDAAGVKRTDGHRLPEGRSWELGMHPHDR